MKKNFGTFIVILGIMSVGLVSRKLSFVPLWIGDMLRAMMVFFIVFLFKKEPLFHTAIIALALCISIEFSQSIHIEVLEFLRSFRLGKLILGQGFLWSDIGAYLLGIGLAYAVKTFHNTTSLKRGEK